MLSRFLKYDKFYQIIKSDRINALRKQYDAFVEEDKKRKERNEYILGRLDKMRYSTALVPVRQKHAPIINHRPSAAYQQLRYQPEVPIPCDFHPPVITKGQLIPDMPINKIDDSYLIQEISKNYILIPKLKSPVMNNYIPQPLPVHNPDILQDKREVKQINTSSVKPNIDDNSDWKSKYEILNILKKEETEKQAVQLIDNSSQPKHLPESLSKNNIPSNNTHNTVAVLNDNNITVDFHPDRSYKYLDELPEKDTPIDKDSNELNISHEINDKTAIHNSEPVLHTTKENPNEVIASADVAEDIAYKLQNTNLDYNCSETDNARPSDEHANYTGQEEYIYTEPTDPNLSGEHMTYEGHLEPINDVNAMIQPNDQNIENTENIYVGNENDLNLAYNPDVQAQFKSEAPEKVEYVDEQDAKPIQVISCNDLMQEINNSAVLPDAEAVEYVEQESENSNVQELPPSVEYQMKSTADCEKLEVDQARINVVHQDPSQEPQTQTVTEVNEMPVSEEQLPDAAGIADYEAEQQGLFYSEHPNNYDYEQGDGNVYDQENPEHEPYDPNHDYTYYESTQQQPIPVNIENEEQTLRYDQTYPQQYVDPYESAYEQKPQQPQQYEEPQTYEQNQSDDLGQLQDQLNYESQMGQNQTQIESQLNAEDGYTEQIADNNLQQIDTPGPENK